ncbi:CRISPR-associated endonuclease Cas2 [Rehaibacterium terrae]|jgi:CRISPR-associated protein Cas2|uniref:CRISPR-associated endoribonuclease Cas2 n=1 Tax=Rehaibacterium terrae TaxID=1341696 RepID=A0A7W7Y0J8_9GAMM|nr:CRISPR-associated endonuclease Cas2 [Rehaibacterium terrae]MBB5015881.1 CRISPR-associated protein Cas2 [Rehaibacterium terrae]
MSTLRRLHIVCYDVSCPRRLRTALVLARRYASGGQKSVHECWLNAREQGDLLADLARLIDEDRDRILCARLDPQRSPMFRGAGRLPCDDDFLLVA